VCISKFAVVDEKLSNIKDDVGELKHAIHDLPRRINGGTS
jgi:hypothetical protein